MRLEANKKMLITENKKLGGNNATYDFSDYKTFKELFRDIYDGNMTTDKAEGKQEEFDARDKKYVDAKDKLLDNAKNFYKGREKILGGFKNGIFSFQRNDKDSEFKDKNENDIRGKNGLIDHKKIERLILLERGTSDELVRKLFLV